MEPDFRSKRPLHFGRRGVEDAAGRELASCTLIALRPAFQSSFCTALGALMAGNFEMAHAMGNHMLTDMITEAGVTMIGGGFANPDREQLKADLMLEIYRAIKGRKLTQVEAGKILGIAQPHVSGLMSGRSGNYAVGRLFEFLNALGRDVEIAVRPKAVKAAGAHTSVVVHP